MNPDHYLTPQKIVNSRMIRDINGKNKIVNLMGIPLPYLKSIKKNDIWNINLSFAPKKQTR